MRLRKLKTLLKPDWNDTTRFLFPVLKLDVKTLKNYGFVNAYLSDHLYDVLYDEHLYLLFNPAFTKDFDIFCNQLRSHQLFVDEYDCLGDYGKVMFVFKVPEPFLELLDKFKAGQYSKFPKQYVDNFFKKYDENGKLAVRWQVLTKHPDLITYWESRICDKDKEGKPLKSERLTPDAELWKAPNKKDEIYNFNPNLDIELWKCDEYHKTKREDSKSQTAVP